jgi:tetratricopeptide (TPR) repeat protein
MLRPFRKPAGVLRRHPRLVLLALALGIVGAGVGAGFLWRQYHLSAAGRALERYAFDEAGHHLEQCLQVPWDRAAVHLLAAQAARRRDAYDEAEQHLAACVRLGGMTEAVARERLLLIAQQGDLDGVEGLLQARTGADDPEAVLVLEALAKGYASRFWQAHALTYLNLLLQRQPRHPQALLMRARVWENRALRGETERDADALRDYQQAVEQLPSFEAQLGLAGVLYRVGRPWEAMLEYERLRASQADNPEVLLGLARCRCSLHEVDEARLLLEQLVGQHPPHPTLSPTLGGEGRVRGEALLELGRVSLHAGQLAVAEKWLRRAASVAPAYDGEAHRVLCRCLEALGKTEDARRCLEELREKEAKVLDVERLTLQANREPGNVALRYEVAVKQMRLGREQDAVAALFFVLDQEPRHGPAHQVLADYFERTGQAGRADRHRRAATPAR